VRHQKRFDPVVVALLVDPVGDRDRLVGHLEARAEAPGEALLQGPRQAPQAAVEVLDHPAGGIRLRGEGPAVVVIGFVLLSQPAPIPLEVRG
jgi:hypothetical protein